MLDFIKYHGLGNDFILVEGGHRGRAEPQTALVKRLCARGSGIGADGLMLAHPSTIADLKMTLINSDGSLPEMCGNGLRCLVKHAIDDLAMRAQPLMVETGAGVLACTCGCGCGRYCNRYRYHYRATDSTEGRNLLLLPPLVEGCQCCE